MKAAQIYQYGQSDVVFVNQKTLGPISSSGRLLVQVHAAGVNPIDWKIREGALKEHLSLRFPVTLGLDFSGTVLHVGEGVSGYQKGDEVYGQSSFYHGHGGSFAEYISVDAKAIALKPRNKSHIESAALPLAGVGVYRALVEHMKLAKGHRILIHGGAGGVGGMAVQLAKYLGAFVATTVRTKDIRFMKKLKADHIIDFTQNDFEKELTGYDFVLDIIGGETYYKSLNVLRRGGTIVSFIERPVPKQMQDLGLNAVYQFTQVTDHRLNELGNLVEQGIIRPSVHKVFPLKKVSSALNYQKDKTTRGKVVIEIFAAPKAHIIKSRVKKLLGLK